MHPLLIGEDQEKQEILDEQLRLANDPENKNYSYALRIMQNK